MKMSDIFKQHTQVSRRSSNKFIALCPFHNEKTPSLMIDDTIGKFHCFGCGTTGNFNDMIKFIEAKQ